VFQATRSLGDRAVILNIKDGRERRDRWKLVTAIVEPTWHDNEGPDADQAQRYEGSGYGERPSISVADAITWAHAMPVGVTLYLYDLGERLADSTVNFG
jgi:hypothetical protein